ncbi:unnamed protein product [Diplocarpon coronariae]
MKFTHILFTLSFAAGSLAQTSGAVGASHVPGTCGESWNYAPLPIKGGGQDCFDADFEPELLRLCKLSGWTRTTGTYANRDAAGNVS